MKKLLLFTCLFFGITIASKAQISIGTVITLQPYDVTFIPPAVANYDPLTISLVTDGTRYRVIGNHVVYVGNNSYTLVDLQAVYSYSPIQTISWPAYYTKIAFGSIIF